MNYHIEPELNRQIKLLLEQHCLFRFVGAVLDTGVDLLLRFAL